MSALPRDASWSFPIALRLANQLNDVLALLYTCKQSYHPRIYWTLFALLILIGVNASHVLIQHFSVILQQLYSIFKHSVHI